MKKQTIRLASSALFRLVLVIILLALSLGFAIIQGSFVSWFIFYMLVIPFVYSIVLWFMPIRRFDVQRHTENVRLEQHDTLTMEVTLTRKSRWPLLYVIVEEVLPKGVFDTVEQKETRRLVSVGFKKHVTWTYAIEDVPRGEHQLVGVYVTVSDFFGWVQKTKFIEGKRTVLVFPKVQPFVYKKASRSHAKQSIASRNQQVNQTNVVSGIRDYEPGDRMNWIHWKSFAKTGKLHTKEFELHHDDETLVLMDLADSPLFEAEISFVASILVSARKQFESLHYVGASKTPILFEHIQTDSQLQQAMVHLASVSPEEGEVERIYSHYEPLRKAAVIHFVTANLTMKWVETLSIAAATPNSCIVYCLVEPFEVHKPSEAELLAASRGMRVKYVPANDFSKAFEEGVVL